MRNKNRTPQKGVKKYLSFFGRQNVNIGGKEFF
jgi:hypothetical protein